MGTRSPSGVPREVTLALVLAEIVAVAVVILILWWNYH
jgi:hypothetical protein